MLEKKNKILIFIVSMLVFFIVPVLRFLSGNLSIPTDSSPYFLSLTSVHPLILLGVNIFLSLSALLLIYFVMNNLKLDRNTSFLVIVLMLLSPTFIYFSFVPSFHTIIFFTLAISTYLLTFKNNWSNLFSILLILSLSIFSIFALVPALFILTYILITKRYTLLGILMISFLIFMSLVNYTTSLFVSESYFSTVISDFGGFVGLSLSVAILAVVGLFSFWKHKPQSIPLMFLVVSLIYLSKYDIHFIIYSLPLVCFFAARTLYSFLSSKWEIELVKRATLLIIICTLLFSPVAYSKVMAFEDPSAEALDSLSILKGLPSGRVLSSPKNSFLLRYYGEKTSVLDYNSPMPEDFFKSRSISNARSYMATHEVDYFWITPKMKSEIWKGRESGLIFLLNNYDDFSLVSEIEGYQIWRLERVKS
jgi:hypothetical protein